MGSSLSIPGILNQIPNPDPEKDFISDLITTNDVVIFSKTHCSYCVRAKSRLDQLNVKYRSVEIDQNKSCPGEDCTAVVQALMLQTRMKTVPQIFYKGNLVGGYAELEKMIEGGAFKSLV